MLAESMDLWDSVVYVVCTVTMYKTNCCPQLSQWLYAEISFLQDNVVFQLKLFNTTVQFIYVKIQLSM